MDQGISTLSRSLKKSSHQYSIKEHENENDTNTSLFRECSSSFDLKVNTLNITFGSRRELGMIASVRIVASSPLRRLGKLENGLGTMASPGLTRSSLKMKGARLSCFTTAVIAKPVVQLLH